MFNLFYIATLVQHSRPKCEKNISAGLKFKLISISFIHIAPNAHLKVLRTLMIDFGFAKFV